MAYTMAGLMSAGGLIGFVRKGSKPSLFAGLGTGALFAASGWYIEQNMDLGYHMALASSVFLLASSIPRIIRTCGSKIPMLLGLLGVITSGYYGNKWYEMQYGV